MATMSYPTGVDQIGETAGVVWRILAEQGPLSLAKLVKEADLHRDLVMQAIGWLAREDKVTIEEEARTKIVYLR
ncbi:MAG: winged helix-turn-helix domain-containing protein [Pirellulales bacterium]|nr:winged helix-turn-helix domain-containing protein [Pirellulales bacterium]